MAINDWRIAVSVPESVVFESANTVRRMLNIFLFFEVVCFVLYFLWMMRYVLNVTGEKQKRLDMMNHMYDVEQLLFNAHAMKENVYTSLEKLGSIISAERVSFCILGSDGEAKWYLWTVGKPAEEIEYPNGQEYNRKLLELFATGSREYEY